MKSSVLSWALAALTVVAAVSSSGVDAAHIYNVTSPLASNPSGWTVSGTIETPVLGTKTPGLINDWIFSVTVSNGQTGYTFTDQDAGAIVSFGDVVATDASLYLNGNTQFLFAQNATNYLTWETSPGSSSWKFERYDYPNDLLVEFSPSPLDGSVIATASPSSVPEIDPATGGSALSLVAGMLAMIEQRRRRHGSAAALAA